MATAIKPHSFSAGDTIIASEHNENFDTLFSVINGNLSNVNIVVGAAIAYSKLSLAGSITNADLAGSIANSKLSQITTASKVHGSSITGLASVPSGAGVLPIANIATGTPTGEKFVRDDGTLQITGSPYLAGSVLLISSDVEKIVGDSSTTTPSKAKEIRVARNGTLRISVDGKRFNSDAPGNLRIYRNGVAVGTSRELTDSYQTWSEDISGWASADLCQVYLTRTEGIGSDRYCRNFRIYATTPTVETVVLD